MKPQKAAITRPQTVVYIGPRIPGVTTPYAVYNNGLPETLLRLSNKSAAIKALIIPVNQLKQALEDIKNPSSIYAIHYKQILKQMLGGFNNGI